MAFLFDVLLATILGNIFFFLVRYIIFKYSNTQTQTIFTSGISTEIITFKDNYQQILSSKLNRDNQGFYINFGKVILEYFEHGWTETEIKVWLKSLDDQDYNVTIEIVSLLSPIHTQWRLFSKEFMVNYDSNPFLIAQLINEQLLSLYKGGDIDNEYRIFIYYSPLTRTNFHFFNRK